MSASLIFIDTETTGLALTDDIWEFAGIRRYPDGQEKRLHLFIEHDWNRCKHLPESFKSDHLARFPGHGQATSQPTAAQEIADFMAKDDDGSAPHIVGAVPNFDTERLLKLLANFSRPWSAHYHLIDVENLAVGYIAGVGQQAVNDGAVAAIDLARIAPPWDSDGLSIAIGVKPPTNLRHTAMGDAQWAMAIYDRVIGGA